jgi:hypothetical protein
MQDKTEELSALLSAMREQSQAYRQQLVDRADIVPATTFGLSASDLEEMVTAGRLFTLEFNGALFYPAFFNSPDLNMTRLGDICQILGPLSGGQKWQFFTRPKHSLGGKTPLDALRNGEFELVNRAAIMFASV